MCYPILSTIGNFLDMWQCCTWAARKTRFSSQLWSSMWIWTW